MNVHAGRNTKAKSAIGQRELEKIIEAVGGTRMVEDIYPLSPTQQGMLFHSLYEPQSTAYYTTLSCRLVGALDVDAFAQAWQMLVERHTVLRSAFVGQDLERPLQAAFLEVGMPVVLESAGDLEAAGHDA